MKTSEALYRLLREQLPYGVWTCADNREVLFSREYKPMWTRIAGQQATIAMDPNEWVKWKTQRYFFDDWSTPWFDQAGYPAKRRAAAREGRTRSEAALRAFLRGELIQPEWIDP